jgi:hypothetical protein
LVHVIQGTGLSHRAVPQGTNTPDQWWHPRLNVFERVNRLDDRDESFVRLVDRRALFRSVGKLGGPGGFTGLFFVLCLCSSVSRDTAVVSGRTDRLGIVAPLLHMLTALSIVARLCFAQYHVNLLCLIEIGPP